MINNFEKLLFQKAKIERFVKGQQTYDAKQNLTFIDKDIPVGMSLKNASATDGNGNVIIINIYTMVTQYSNILAGDIITVEGYGTFKASKPYPVKDRTGIHHYKIILREEADA